MRHGRCRLYVVMELAVGGEMFGRIAERVGLSSPMKHYTLEKPQFCISISIPVMIL